jgi:hypothetical protein
VLSQTGQQLPINRSKNKQILHRDNVACRERKKKEKSELQDSGAKMDWPSKAIRAELLLQTATREKEREMEFAFNFGEILKSYTERILLLPYVGNGKCRTSQ